MRTTTQPERDERGYERHPAWGLIGASRVSASAPGHPLFDSDIRHQHYVVVRLSHASRMRDLNRDWIHADARMPVVEIAMSEAQWASFVSSMNAGDGVPCTIERTQRDGELPRVPYEPRLRESIAEVKDAAERAAESVAEAFATYANKKTAANLRSLEATIRNLAPNITYAAESLTEHAENVVQKARVDIEAMVVAKAHQLGLEPGDLGATAPQLSGGNEES